MPRKPDPTPRSPQPDYATVRLTHYATFRERADRLRQHPRRRACEPECLTVGHAWTEDPGREGGTMCMVCQVVRWP